MSQEQKQGSCNMGERSKYDSEKTERTWNHVVAMVSHVWAEGFLDNSITLFTPRAHSRILTSPHAYKFTACAPQNSSGVL